MTTCLKYKFQNTVKSQYMYMYYELDVIQKSLKYSRIQALHLPVCVPSHIFINTLNSYLQSSAAVPKHITAI